jgi:hypothetical protein
MAQMSVFRQGAHESMSKVWETYKKLLNLCPHHKIYKWINIKGFYQNLMDNNRMPVNLEAGGNFIQTELDEALRLIDRLATQEQ